jgi:hypothetical protein
MRGDFDYKEFTREFKAICGSLENGEESKYDEHLKTTDLLLNEFFDEVFKPALSDKGFCFPTDVNSVAQLFQSIYSVCSSPRERLILLLGESLVYATFGNMFNAETEAG